MNLKSFGCSFIFGSELADTNHAEENINPSKNTWPAHLAQYLNAQYECHARPGSGNLQILEKVLNQASGQDNSNLFVIGWTWIDRFDYYNSNYDGTPWQDWLTIRPSGTDNLSNLYYRDLHSEYRDKFTCLSYIKLAIDTLKQKNILFIMTYMDELLFDQRWHTSPAVIALQEYIKPYMTTFEGQSFLDWSRSKGYPETAARHPLETAHAAAGEYIIKVFRKQSTNVQVL
jgi:hypothetical protein